MVRVTRLELVRHGHTPLKRACLPIPAHSQIKLFLLGARLLYHQGAHLSTKNFFFFKFFLFSSSFNESKGIKRKRKCRTRKQVKQ